MSGFQAVFKRTEIKYLLSPLEETALMGEIESRLCKDTFSHSTISNLYFDTEDYQLIRSSIEKPIYKEKLRLRSYETPTASTKVFVELKKKVDGTVYKRRLSLPHHDAMAYLMGEEVKLEQTQIRKEIDWFMTRYSLLPKAFISYDRSAWKGLQDQGLRITFDRNILFRGNHLDLSSGAYGFSVLDPDKTLMEIKMTYPMPLWLSMSLNSLGIFPVSYSKYGNCYKSYIWSNHNSIEGGVSIA